jgi:hypothetical protein
MAILQRCVRLIIVVIALTCPLGAQSIPSSDLTTFQTRVDEYVQMHRRLAGPLPAVAVTSNMDDVLGRMDALRAGLQVARKGDRQGQFFTPAVIRALGERIAAVMSADDIRSAMEDIDEHMPPDMPPLRVNEPLPEDAPFGMVPPPVLRELPTLPGELRYMVLSKALIIWDQQADLVVDIAPGLFDAGTYGKAKSGK